MLPTDPKYAGDVDVLRSCEQLMLMCATGGNVVVPAAQRPCNIQVHESMPPHCGLLLKSAVYRSVAPPTRPTSCRSATSSCLGVGPMPQNRAVTMLAYAQR